MFEVKKTKEYKVMELWEAVTETAMIIEIVALVALVVYIGLGGMMFINFIGFLFGIGIFMLTVHANWHFENLKLEYIANEYHKDK